MSKAVERIRIRERQLDKALLDAFKEGLSTAIIVKPLRVEDGLGTSINTARVRVWKMEKEE